MGLSHDIISEFVRITNDKKEKPKEGIVYGVVAQTSDGNYVKIDGSDLITPAETTTEVQDGERVTVMIKDHTATITGNVTSPSANSNSINKKFESVSDKIGTFELIVADKISANELEVYKATIDVLIAGKATIQDLEVVNATIEHLYAQNATIENLVANKASIKDLDVVNATIENLKAKDAEIEHAVIDHLEATLADIKVLNADFAQIRTLVNGNLTSDNILSFNITSDKVTMEDAFIKDAMIANVSAAKINAGKINTNNVTIGSEDGGMLITGSTQQFVDKDGNVRIQIGRDAKGDFTFILYGEDGVGQLINQNGITASAISDGLIVNDMVSDKAAISGEKLDISSVITEINNDNSTTIKSNKIYLNEQEQSLEVAFNSLKTQVETIKDITVSGDLSSVIDRVQANTTEIEVNKERINTLILEDSIIKKQVTDLEGDVVETSTTLASKYSELDQTIEGFKTSVADTYATKSTVNDISNNLSTNYSTTSAMNSAIEQKVDEINLSISETYATNETVNDINDNLLKNYSTTSVMNSTINQKVDEITLSVSETYATISSVDGINDKLSTEYPTITQMDSAITQKGNEISLTVSESIKNIQTGGKNIIKNGNFENGTNDWYYERFSGVETVVVEIWDDGEWTLNNKAQFSLHVEGVNDSNRMGEWTLRQGFKTTVGQTYTISYLISGHRSNKKVAVRRGDNWIYLGSKDYGEILGGTNVNDWTYDSITFVAESPDTGIWFSINEIYTGDNGYLWITDVCCVEGSIPHRFTPNIDEYATISEMDSAITQKADEIALTVAKKEIENMQVGGTNLLTGTKTLTGAGISGHIVEKYKGCNVIHENNNNGSHYKDVISYDGLMLEPSTEYTLSFWAKGGGFITSYLYPDAVEFGHHHNFENRTTNKEDGAINTDLEEGTWKRYAITWKTKPNVSEEKALIVGRLHGGIPNVWCDISAPKFEKGNKPTDWSESPLEYSTTTEMNSAIQQKADEINLSVSQTINNIQTGGKNLIKNGNFEDGLNHWVYERFSGVETANIEVWTGNLNDHRDEWCMDGKKHCAVYVCNIDDSNRHGEWTIRQHFKTVVGQEYTISYMIAGHRSNKKVAVRRGDNWIYIASKDYGELYGGKNANDWVYDSITFTATSSDTEIWFSMLEVISGIDGHMWFTDVCCIEGNKAQRFIPSFEEYSTTTQMNSAIQLKADSITSAVNMTSIAGVELMPQSHKRNSTSGYHVHVGNGQLYVNQWGLFVAAQAWVSSDFIAIDPGLPLKYYFFMENTNGYNPLTYLGFEQYNWKKEEIGVNASTIYVVQEKFTGYKSVADTIPENSFNSNTKYIKLRWLINWDNSAFEYTYLMDCSVKQLGSINQSTQIAQMSDKIESTVSSVNAVAGRLSTAESKITQHADKIESTVSSVNAVGGRLSTAESKITQHADQIATKVDVNGVKSTIQQNPESVRIGFNGISNYFDLNSTRLQVGHSDGSYTQIGQNGVTYYANGSGNRYHNLMKQGWTETVAMSNYGANGWSLIVTLPSEFRGKVFSVIPCITYVSCPNLADAIKGFEVNIPQENVNYNQGSFVIHLYASGLWAEGLSIHYNVIIRMTWIAIA